MKTFVRNTLHVKGFVRTTVHVKGLVDGLNSFLFDDSLYLCNTSMLFHTCPPNNR